MTTPNWTAGDRTHEFCFIKSDCITGLAGPELLHQTPGVDLFTFNYVCVENAKALRESQFRYFEAIFGAAKVGCVFVFQDASFFLWGEIVGVLDRVGPQHFTVLHPHPQPHQCHNSMVVVKVQDERLVR